MGFFRVENRVIDEMEFENTAEMAVFFVIARYSNNSRYSFPSLDLLTEKCRCARGTAMKAIKSLEEKGLITVERVLGKSNRYTIESSLLEKLPSSSNVQGSSSRELYKEQEININRRREFLTKIHELASRGTGDNVFLFQQVFTGRGLNEKELEVMRVKIEESDFLMGRLENKPTIRHYDSQKQIDKIRMGYYRNSEREKKKPQEEKPPYHYEFEEREVVHYEPNY